MSDITETWAPVVGWEDTYQVSTLGRIRHARTLAIKKLQTHKTHGYMFVNLDNGKRHQALYVHRVVLSAFLGPMDRKMDGCHMNGIKTDNCLDNLKWGTRSQNNRDKRLHGRVPMGEKTPKAKVKDADVLRMRELSKTTSLSALGRTFGLSKSAARAIVSRKSWRHL